MEAMRQIVRIPSNHEVRIKIPEHIAENELLEVILLVRKRKQRFKDKINELKDAVNNPMYIEDMKSVAQDFEQKGDGTPPPSRLLYIKPST